MALLCLLAFFTSLHSVVSLSSTADPASLWNRSNMPDVSMMGGSRTLAVLSNGTAVLGFHSMDGAFVLSIMFVWSTPQVIWSANRDNPVNDSATLNFTGEGELLLRDGDGTLVWSTPTKGWSVAGIRLDGSGNLVLFDHNNVSVWQSFDNPTDSLVLGQSLCQGMNLSAAVSTVKWASSKIYLAAEWNGLLYKFEPAAYDKLFPSPLSSNARTNIRHICYAFVNGSLGSPNQIFSLPPARSMQFLRLESDGHLRLYESPPERLYGISRVMVFDVLSTVMNSCDYPLTCGDYSFCSSGQCSCASLSYFQPRKERHPRAGCVPLTALSCNHMHDQWLLPLGNVSYYSYDVVMSLAITSATQEVCKKACLMNCSCKIAVFKDDSYYGNTGSCLLLSDSQLLLLVEDSSNNSWAFIKIQGNASMKKSIRIAVGSSIGGLVVFTAVVSAVIWKNCKKVEEELFDGIPGIPKRFSYIELKVATNNFSVRLGGGGFGSVFEGKIGKENIAVKRLEGVDQGKEEFLAEVETIGRTHHLNLVRLIGFCAERYHRLLVYEYMCNGSLDKWIFSTNPVFSLSWDTRRNIIMGIARGLSYLHEECKQKIAHLDIKPQNILLDDKFNAKLSDFGLSKMINRDQSKVMTRMRGTRGYLAPEWLGSKITEKADIYSFGIVVMEIICGRQNLDELQPEESIHLISLLQEKARSEQLFDLVDSGSNDMRFRMEEVIEMMKLAMWCLQVDSNRRPLMSTVAKVLEGAMSLESRTPDYNFIPNFSSHHGDAMGLVSLYMPSDSATRLSGPR